MSGEKPQPDIRALFGALHAAAEANDDSAGVTAGLLLAEIVVNDLHRIADALETLAKPASQ